MCQHTSAFVSIRQHTSAYASIRQHTSGHVSIRQHTSAYGCSTTLERRREVTTRACPCCELDTRATCSRRAMSYAIRHTSYVIRHTSYVIRHTCPCCELELAPPALGVQCHTPYVIRHTSYVIRHTSYVIRAHAASWTLAPPALGVQCPHPQEAPRPRVGAYWRPSDALSATVA